MINQVDHFDHHAEEPPDRFHSDYDTFLAWLDAEAPAEHAQKLRNRPKHRRKRSNMKLWAPTLCAICGGTFDGRDIVEHLQKQHPVRP